jgi:hypothetical protein
MSAFERFSYRIDHRPTASHLERVQRTGDDPAQGGEDVIPQLGKKVLRE